MFFTKWRGWFAIFLILLIPVVLWYRQASIASSVFLFTNIGQVLGLVGLTCFALTLALNTRWKFLEELFNGLDKLYLAHHIMGTLTLTILLFHPLSLVISYLSVSVGSAANFLITGLGLATDMGKIALSLMILFLILTLFVNLPYHIWKFTHQFLGVSFAFASLHMFLIVSDVSYNYPLRLFMFGIIFLGLYAYLYRMFLHKFLLPKYLFTVSSVKNLNGEINEIILVPEQKNIDFNPGQFVFARFKNKHTGNEQHPFSITSRRGSKTLELAIESLGDFTSKLKFLNKGDRVVVEGPYGKFASDATSRPSIWIAGGIGITPFVSLARSFSNQNPTYLFYSAKEDSDFIYKNEFQKIAKENDKLKLIFWNSGERGHLTAEQIKNKVGEITKYSFYLCGPWKMMMSIKKSLKEMHVKDHDIHYEEFELV
jgi:predicted ferric reductase